MWETQESFSVTYQFKLHIFAGGKPFENIRVLDWKRHGHGRHVIGDRFMRDADGFAGDINRADLAVNLEGSRMAGGAAAGFVMVVKSHGR